MLLNKHCVPCRDGTAPYTRVQAERHRLKIPDWSLSPDTTYIQRDFHFKNFAAALAFVNRIGAIAETENHHPDIRFGWGYCTVTLRTHKIGGLHQNDFILAAKIDACFEAPLQENLYPTSGKTSHRASTVFRR